MMRTATKLERKRMGSPCCKSITPGRSAYFTALKIDELNVSMFLAAFDVHNYQTRSFPLSSLESIINIPSPVIIMSLDFTGVISTSLIASTSLAVGGVELAARRPAPGRNFFYYFSSDRP
ncbi:hypothetical protein RRG08_005694 [Elysia crispata]|uniref:Uncharacterized protein n=1 Tax=Elysia crispata TaxID=231223 RepID=A0AAE1CWH8_9GAST|nr:hypothetical protein RRG08_005694 [Elysia crispata]